MNKKYCGRKQILVLCTLCFCVLTLYSFGKFEKTFSEMELKNKQKELKQTAEIKAKSVQKRYANMINSLEALADNLKDASDFQKEEHIRQISLLANVGYFNYVGISDEEGNMIDSAKQTANIKERGYFQEAMAGKTVISDVMKSKVRNGEEIQVIAHPIMQEEEPRGIVFGIMNIDSIDQLLESETGSDIYVNIIDSQGNYIVGGESQNESIKYKNLWDDFLEYEFLEGSPEEIKDNMKRGQKTKGVSFRLGEKEWFAYYMPLGLRKYYIAATVNSEYLKQWKNMVSREATAMVLKMTSAFFILGMGLYLYNRKVQEELTKSHSDAVSSEKMMSIAIRENEQVVFEYNIHTETLRKKAGITIPLFPNAYIEKAAEVILKQDILTEASVSEFKALFENIKEQESVEGILQTKKRDGICWYRMIMKNIYNEKQEILNTVGIVEDITEQKIQEELLEVGQKEKQVLQKLAERDGLTGLYNAATTKLKIQEALKKRIPEEGCHLFVLLDLDNFKEINDTFGHQYGDKVLKEVSGILKKTFRKDDILGRLGGDEFVLFLFDVPDTQVMEPIFAKLCQELQKTYTKEGKAVTVSGSLGIAVAPEQGTTFQALYGKSDQALYEVKKHAKNGYKFYKDME